MKNRIASQLCCVGVLLTGAFSAYAQSNVSIYGLINLGVAKESNKPAKVDRGYLNWLGFAGSEDLGGGLSATFNLMTRFSPNTGTLESSVFWHGESTVGLKSSTLGAVRLGRGLTPLFAYKWEYEPWGDSWLMGSLGRFQAGSFVANPLACVSDCPGFARVDNGIFYDSPSIGGFQLSVSGQAGVEPGVQKRNTGVALNYRNGPFMAMLSAENNTVHQEATFVAAKYDFGGGTVMGSFNQNSLPNAPKERNLMVAGTYVIGGPSSVRFGYGKNTNIGDHKISAGYVHTLSKRTFLYSDLYREKTYSASTINTNGFGAGMQHSF